MITTVVKLSYERQTVPPIVSVVQGDTGRNLSCVLSDYTIPEDATATFYIQKPSGMAVYNTAEISSETNVQIELDAQCTAEAGENFGQVRISLDGEVITSFEFILLVKPFRGIGSVESRTEMNIFDQAVAQAIAEIGATLDATLSIQNKAADAKATGDAIKAVIESIIPTYDEDTIYYMGDACKYGSNYYICNPLPGSSAISGVFDSDQWVQVASVRKYLARALTIFFESVCREYNPTNTYAVGDFCLRYGSLKRCKTAISTPEAYTSGHWDTVTIPGLIEETKVSFSDPNHDGHITVSIGG